MINRAAGGTSGWGANLKMSLSSDVVRAYDPDDARLSASVAERVATFRTKAGLAQMLKGGLIM